MMTSGHELPNKGSLHYNTTKTGTGQSAAARTTSNRHRAPVHGCHQAAVVVGLLHSVADVGRDDVSCIMT